MISIDPLPSTIRNALFHLHIKINLFKREWAHIASPAEEIDEHLIATEALLNFINSLGSLEEMIKSTKPLNFLIKDAAHGNFKVRTSDDEWDFNESEFDEDLLIKIKTMRSELREDLNLCTNSIGDIKTNMSTKKIDALISTADPRGTEDFMSNRKNKMIELSREKLNIFYQRNRSIIYQELFDEKNGTVADRLKNPTLKDIGMSFAKRNVSEYFEDEPKIIPTDKEIDERIRHRIEKAFPITSA